MIMVQLSESRISGATSRMIKPTNDLKDDTCSVASEVSVSLAHSAVCMSATLLYLVV